MILLQGVIQQLRGPNFTQFWSPPSSSGQLWAIYMIPTLCRVTMRELSTDPGPSLSSCPRSYVMTPCRFAIDVMLHLYLLIVWKEINVLRLVRKNHCNFLLQKNFQRGFTLVSFVTQQNFGLRLFRFYLNIKPRRQLIG